MKVVSHEDLMRVIFVRVVSHEGDLCESCVS